MSTSYSTRQMRVWLRSITLEGASANIHIVLTGGAFVTGIALYMGANDFYIGLLGAVPFLAQLAQLLAAYLVDRSGKLKSLTLWALAAGRQVWWLVIPLLFLEGSWRLAALLAIVAVSNAGLMLGAPIWLTWMADLVPERIRGRYFANRNSAVSVTTILATLAGGWVLDRFRGADSEATGFAVLIIAGCIGALMALKFLHRIPEREFEVRRGFRWSNISVPLRDRSFRKVLRVFLIWNLAIGLSAAFFVPHMLTNLHMNFTLIALYSAVASVVAIVSNKMWGRLIDRFGIRPVVVLCAGGISLVPVVWIFVTVDTRWLLWIEAALSGFVWTGFNLAAFNTPIANSPRKDRPIYLAIFAVVTGLAYFTASTVGGIITEHWSNLRWVIGSLTIINYHLVFGLSVVVRVLTAVLALGLPEPRETRFPIMIQMMGYAALKRLSLGRQLIPWSSRKVGGTTLLAEKATDDVSKAA